MLLKAPEITADVFERLEDEDGFRSVIDEQFRYVAGRAHLTPLFSESRLHDAFQAWREDIDRLPGDMPGGNRRPDHFKRCGVLAYWLRRCAPVIDYYDNAKSPTYPHQVLPSEDGLREIMRHYSTEYLAFDLGIRICKVFVSFGGGGGSADFTLSEDYIEMMCHFLKRKHVSPHALILIYRSLFRA